MTDISKLKDEEDDPVGFLSGNVHFKILGHLVSPVDRCNDGVQGESRMMVLVLTPNCPASIYIVMGSVESIVDTADDDEQPCYEGRDLVDHESLWTHSLSFGEWIYWKRVISF